MGCRGWKAGAGHRDRRGQKTRRQYQIVRTAYEEVGSDSRRSPSEVKLIALNSTGTPSIDKPESTINDELPPELREVFFTDGDKALAFIDADITLSTKRDRVQRAIRSLLGLSVIENAIKHVRKTAANVNKEAKQLDGGSELSDIAARLESIEEESSKLEVALADAKRQFSAFEDKLNEIDKQIEAALLRGDKEQLKKDLDAAKKEIKRLNGQMDANRKGHSDIFRGHALAEGLMAPVLRPAYEKLDELHDQGKIPSTTIPVLEDRLEANICICGETLSHGDPGGERRINHIRKLIDENKKTDEIREITTSLYYAARSRRAGIAQERWIDDYAKVTKNHGDIDGLLQIAGKKLRSLEISLDSLPDTDIRGLRDTRRSYKGQRDRFMRRISEIETEQSANRRDQVEWTQKRDRLLREQAKGSRIIANSEVADDILRVLEGAYNHITSEELQKVSRSMNEIFLEMIGADPDQGSLIRRAEISSDYDITVYGPGDRKLNPDIDLNGASRRALTLAFILALTKVSKVEAPNVIDTPLGMASGYVRQSILKTAVRESAQLILFLTHDEILGCEDIIDQFAGEITTITNSAHYPVMLVNDPGTTQYKALTCQCNHRGQCRLCKRRADAEV